VTTHLTVAEFSDTIRALEDSQDTPEICREQIVQGLIVNFVGGTLTEM